MSAKKKLGCIYKAIIITGATFMGLALVLVLLVNVIDSNYTLVRSSSPNGKVEVIIEYKAPFVFSAHEVEVFYKKDNAFFERELLKTTISNDGANLGTDNYTIKWIDESNVMITFSGEEQNDEVFTIDFDKEEKVTKKYSKY